MGRGMGQGVKVLWEGAAEATDEGVERGGGGVGEQKGARLTTSHSARCFPLKCRPGILFS